MSVGRKKKDPLDRYDTDAESTRVLLQNWRPRRARRTRALGPEQVLGTGEFPLILEPAAGAGQMVDILRDHFPAAAIVASDVQPRREDIRQSDFLDRRSCEIWSNRRGSPMRAKSSRAAIALAIAAPNLIITNPPFRLAEQFLRQAMHDVAPAGYVAFLLRAAFLETKRRRNLLDEFPPVRVYFLRRRPHFSGPNSNPKKKGGDASMYAWIIWQQGKRPKNFIGRII